jgi:two-component system, NarL family, nitrate/nitrite response regulator NarL
MNSKTSIYILDDHQIVVDGLKLLINDHDQYRVIGYNCSSRDAIHEIIQLEPEILLLDFRMPDYNGIQVLQEIQKKIITKVVLLSMSTETRYMKDAKIFGAKGFLLKNCGKRELYQCLDIVREGGQFFPKFLTTEMRSISNLTERELEVLKLIIEEKSTKEIALALEISELTVETHRKHIKTKTGAINLVGLVRYAINNNLIDGG